MNQTQSDNYSAPGTTFCVKCGGSLAPGAKFCTKCGTPVQQTPAQEGAAWQEPVQQAPEAPVQQAPAQEAQTWQAPAQEAQTWQAPAQEAQTWQPPAQQPQAWQAPPQQPPIQQAPPQAQPVQQEPPKKKKGAFFKYFLLAVVGIVLVAAIALVALKLLSEQGIIDLPKFLDFELFPAASDKSGDQDGEDGSGEQPDGQEGDSSADREADYDLNVWDDRFPARPVTAYQQYYVIYYEGSQNNRIDMAVFDLEGALNGNCLLWDPADGSLALKDYSAMLNCSRYSFDGDDWVKDADKVRWISAGAANVISSNLDIYDWDSGRLVLPYITSAGISTPIDYSYYQPAVPDELVYALPGSDSRYLTREDLEGFTADECRIARSELYARHGVMFAEEDLQNYFNQFSWYSPQIQPDNVPDDILNEYEAANLTLIQSYEEDMEYN